MSVAVAKEYLDSIDNNEAAVGKLMDAFDYETGTWNGDMLVTYGKEAGYEFTAEDVKKAGEETYSGELSDEQLEYVSGGKCCCCSSSSCCGVAAN